MTIDEALPNPEDRTSALERGFARVMAAVTNADDRERARLLRIADSADRAHDAYARIMKPDQEDNVAVRVLQLADVYGSAEAQATTSADPTKPPDETDLSLAHADDAFLDALGADEPDLEQDVADDQLTTLLRSWRQEVDAEPIDDLVDSKLTIVTVHAVRSRRRRSRLLVSIAAAAAVLSIAFGGVGIAARNAQPGDAFWGITKVLYSDYARSVEAAEAVRADLREAKAALAEGNIEMAKSRLRDARETLPTVLPDDDKEDLQDQLIGIEAMLRDNPS